MLHRFGISVDCRTKCSFILILRGNHIHILYIPTLLSYQFPLSYGTSARFIHKSWFLLLKSHCINGFVSSPFWKLQTKFPACQEKVPHRARHQTRWVCVNVSQTCLSFPGSYYKITHGWNTKADTNDFGNFAFWSCFCSPIFTLVCFSIHCSPRPLSPYSRVHLELLKSRPFFRHLLPLKHVNGF